MKFHICALFQKSAEKIRVSLKLHKNKGYFTWRPAYLYDISLNSSDNEKCFLETFVEIVKTRVLSWITPPPRKPCRLLDNVGKYTQYALLRFHCNSGYANTPQWYIIRALPIMYKKHVLYIWAQQLCTSTATNHNSVPKHEVPLRPAIHNIGFLSPLTRMTAQC